MSVRSASAVSTLAAQRRLDALEVVAVAQEGEEG